MVNVSDQISGLGTLGTDLGGMLTAIAPGVGIFILLLGIFGGIAGIVYAIVSVIKTRVGKA